SSLPTPLAGLIIAAILAAAMASLGAALNSLASTTVVDFLRVRKTQMSEAQSMRIARWATVAWGIVLLAIAYGARKSPSVLQAGLSIASIPFGALLGVFLLGVLPKRPGETAAICGVIAGLATVLGVRYGTPIAWTWYVLIGTTVTFGVGVLVGMFTPAPSPAQLATPSPHRATRSDPSRDHEGAPTDPATDANTYAAPPRGDQNPDREGAATRSPDPTSGPNARA